MASSKILAFFLYHFVLQAYASGFCFNEDDTDVQRDCGSFQAVSHLSPSILGYATDRIRSNPSLNFENGGAASLHTSATDVGSHTQKCGAILISNRHLLTAAHCVAWDAEERVIAISLGRPNLKKVANIDSEVYRIQSVTVHPNYGEGGRSYNDIAIIKSSRNITFRPSIWPFCLPESDHLYEGYAQISGWGQVNQSHTASTIQNEFVNIIANDCCDNLWNQFAPNLYSVISNVSYPRGLNHLLLCAGRYGVDACKGDSGSPMYQNINGHNTVIAIIAKGVPTCPENPILPGFYTKIQHYLDWIYTHTGIPRPRPKSLTFGTAIADLQGPQSPRPDVNFEAATHILQPVTTSISSQEGLTKENCITVPTTHCQTEIQTISTTHYSTQYQTISKTLYSTQYQTISTTFYSTQYQTISTTLYSTQYQTVPTIIIQPTYITETSYQTAYITKTNIKTSTILRISTKVQPTSIYVTSTWRQLVH